MMYHAGFWVPINGTWTAGYGVYVCFNDTVLSHMIPIRQPARCHSHCCCRVYDNDDQILIDPDLRHTFFQAGWEPDVPTKSTEPTFPVATIPLLQPPNDVQSTTPPPNPVNESPPNLVQVVDRLPMQDCMCDPLAMSL